MAGTERTENQWTKMLEDVKLDLPDYEANMTGCQVVIKDV